MQRSVIIFVSLIFISGLTFGQAIAGVSSTREQKSPDEEALGKLIVALDPAWNKRDAQMFAALFTIDGDLQLYTGRLLQGREDIERYYRTTAFPSIPPGWRHTTIPTQLRFIRADVAIGDSEVQITSIATDEKEEQLILSIIATGVLVKEQDNWHFAAVRLMVPQTR